MTKLQYAQEYLGEFIDDLRQFFKEELITKTCTISRSLKNEVNPSSNLTFSSSGDKFLGVDVARMGEDESVMLSLTKNEKKELRQFDMLITTKTLLTTTIMDIKNLDKKHHYKRIYIDDGGLGSGVFDPLLQDPQTKNRVIPINNSSRSLDRDDKRRKKIMKEDLYNNLLWLMENGQIKLFDEEEIKLSLRSIQYEYNEKGQLIIFGNYTHIVEALIRAAWCVKDKTIGLNIWCR